MMFAHLQVISGGGRHRTQLAHEHGTYNVDGVFVSMTAIQPSLFHNANFGNSAVTFGHHFRTTTT